MDDTTLTVTIAQHLDGQGVGVWSQTEAYPKAATGIYYREPSDATDQAIILAVYNGTDNPQNGQADRWLQVRTRGSRGDPAGADTIATAVFHALQDTHPDGVAHIARTSFAPLGADDNGRQERTDNYQLTLNNPEVLR